MYIYFSTNPAIHYLRLLLQYIVHEPVLILDDKKDAYHLFLTFEDIISGNEMEQNVLPSYSLLFFDHNVSTLNQSQLKRRKEQMVSPDFEFLHMALSEE